jgi:hypothetical protein
MKDLNEALAKFATQAWCEPLVGFAERARYPRLPKPYILSVFRRVEEVGGQRKYVILPGEEQPVLGRCNCDSQALSGVEMCPLPTPMDNGISSCPIATINTKRPSNDCCIPAKAWPSAVLQGRARLSSSMPCSMNSTRTPTALSSFPMPGIQETA